MTQAPTPRGPLGQLIDDAKVASGKQWRTVESESGIPLATIQAWTSGRSEEPSLRGLLHLARYLKIPAEKVADASLKGYVPPLRASTSGAGNGRGTPPVVPDIAASADARLARRAPAGQQTPRQPRDQKPSG